MPKKSERKRGVIEFQRQLEEVLRVRWPRAFPFKSHEVRPLAYVAPLVAEATGWSRKYTQGVLSAWKSRESYCRAILAYSNRIDLNGSLTEEIVDDKARTLARGRLEQIAAKKAKDAERREMEDAERAAAEAASPTPAPAPAPEAAPEPIVEATPSPPPADPEPERPRTRKLLTLGPAAKEALLKRGLGTTETVATIQRRAR